MSGVPRGSSPSRDRAPIWPIGLTALLVASGFGRRPYAAPEPTGARGDVNDGRGRSATTPSDIPARGWKDILLRVYEGISEDRILANAAAVTFYTLLALFPGIAALVSIYGLFADPTTIATQLDAVAGILPGGAVDVIRDQLTRLTSQGSATLGVSCVFGRFISLWSADGGSRGLFMDVHDFIGDVRKGRCRRLNDRSMF